jgi:hypothetical protein
MHCLIHIGVHKTGSTAFQLAMSRSRWQLREIGLLYPAKPYLQFDKFVCHHGLAERMVGQQFDGIYDEYTGLSAEELEQAIEDGKPHYIVLSSEVFSIPFAGRAENDPLIKLLLRRGCSISVVAMIRPQVGLLHSSYMEGVMSFFNYVKFREYMTIAVKLPFFKYSSRLSPWTSSQKISFVAVPYSKVLKHHKLTETILKAGGIPEKIIDAAHFSKTERINQNPGAMTIGACRYFIPHLHQLQFDPLRDKLKAFVFEEAERRGWTDVPYQGYTKPDVDYVRKRFQQGNSEFAQRYWGRKWSEVFGISSRPTWQSNEVDLETISAAVRKEFDSFQQTIEAHLMMMRKEIPGICPDRS